jgi:hypothetical protein
MGVGSACAAPSFVVDPSFTFPAGGLTYAAEPNRLVRLAVSSTVPVAVVHVLETYPDGSVRHLSQLDAVLDGPAHRQAVEPDCESLFGGDLTASLQAVSVAAVDQQSCSDGASDDSIPGPVTLAAVVGNGPVQMLERCSRSALGAARLDGTLAAYLSCHQGTLFVRDLASAATPVNVALGEPPPISPQNLLQTRTIVAFAGDYVAVGTPAPGDGIAETIATYDWRTGQQVTTLTGVDFSDIELSAAGTLLLNYRPAVIPNGVGCGDPVMISPSAPLPQALPQVECVNGGSVYNSEYFCSTSTGPALCTLDGRAPQPAPPRLVGLTSDGQAEFATGACGATEQLQFEPVTGLVAAP